jgi:hypothetical protein
MIEKKRRGKKAEASRRRLVGIFCRQCSKHERCIKLCSKLEELLPFPELPALLDSSTLVSMDQTDKPKERVDIEMDKYVSEFKQVGPEEEDAEYFKLPPTPLARAGESLFSEDEIMTLADQYRIFRGDQKLRSLFEEFVGCTSLSQIAKGINTDKQNIQTIFKRRITKLVKESKKTIDKLSSEFSDKFRDQKPGELTPKEFKKKTGLIK